MTVAALTETSPLGGKTGGNGGNNFGNDNMDLVTYRINYELAGWQKIADERGHMCAPFGAILAVNALCDEVESLRKTIATLNESLRITSEGNFKLRQQLAEAHAETDSVAHARDDAYRILAELQYVAHAVVDDWDKADKLVGPSIEKLRNVL